MGGANASTVAGLLDAMPSRACPPTFEAMHRSDHSLRHRVSEPATARGGSAWARAIEFGCCLASPDELEALVRRCHALRCSLVMMVTSSETKASNQAKNKVFVNISRLLSRMSSSVPPFPFKLYLIFPCPSFCPGYSHTKKYVKGTSCVSSTAPPSLHGREGKKRYVWGKSDGEGERTRKIFGESLKHRNTDTPRTDHPRFVPLLRTTLLTAP